MESIKDNLNCNVDGELEQSITVEKSEKLNIILYLVSKTTSMLGTNIYNFALSLYILKLTGSGVSFAINVLIGTLPRIVLGPFAGIIADRVNRKKLTIVFDIISGVVVFALLGLSSIYGLKVSFIYVTGFILSTINTFYDTSISSALPNLVRDKKLLKINSYSQVSGSVSGILSPILAGLIYGLVPIKLFLIVNGISFIFSAFLEMAINFNLNSQLENTSKGDMSFGAFKEDIKEVLSFLKKQKVMASLLKYVLMINLFLGAAMSVVYPYVINKVLRMSSSEFGTFQGFYFIGMILASIIMGSKKEKSKTVKNLAFELMLIGIILILIGVPTLNSYVFKSNVILVFYNIVLLFSLGVVLIKINTPIIVSMQRLTPENLRGRLMGVLGTLTGGITPIGILLAGVLIDKVHPFIILLFSGISIILAALPMARNKNMEII